jgi:hypothetical protein
MALLARHFVRRHGERLGRRGVGIDPASPGLSNKSRKPSVLSISRPP